MAIEPGLLQKYRRWVAQALSGSTVAKRVLAVDLVQAGQGVVVSVRVDSLADEDVAMEVARVACGGFGTGSIKVLSESGEVLAQLAQMVTP